jgi:prolyl-tRNA editing enzyme YbaK/EbsC (Cys-tRNA(Pro) deacylase)
MTHALRVLASHGVAHTCHEYRYVAYGGTAEAARQLGVDQHSIVKTLVLESDSRARPENLSAVNQRSCEPEPVNLRTSEPLNPAGRQAPSIVLMLMHGDAEVSTRALARAVGARSIAPCTEAVAERVTGYQVGGISPFGTRQSLPVYVEASILDLPRIFINGGRRGLLVELSPAALLSVLDATPVQARAGSNP